MGDRRSSYTRTLRLGVVGWRDNEAGLPGADRLDVGSSVAAELSCEDEGDRLQLLGQICSRRCAPFEALRGLAGDWMSSSG